MKSKPSNNVPKRGSYTSKCIYYGHTTLYSNGLLREDCNPQDKRCNHFISPFLLEKLDCELFKEIQHPCPLLGIWLAAQTEKESENLASLKLKTENLEKWGN